MRELYAQSHPPSTPNTLGTLWSQPFPQDTGRLGECSLTRQQNPSCSVSTEPLASSVPFPPLRTSSHLFLLTCDKKPLPERWGEGEASKAAEAVLEQLWQSTAQGEACGLPAPVSSGRGQLGDRCTMRGDSSHQLLQSLSPWSWGCKPTQVCVSPQGEQPGEWEGKTPEGDQSREKKTKITLDKVLYSTVKELR